MFDNVQVDGKLVQENFVEGEMQSGLGDEGGRRAWTFYRRTHAARVRTTCTLPPSRHSTKNTKLSLFYFTQLSSYYTFVCEVERVKKKILRGVSEVEGSCGSGGRGKANVRHYLKLTSTQFCFFFGHLYPILLCLN